MGLAQWFIDLGVKVESAVGAVATRTGHAPLQWPAGEDEDSLVHRLTRDAHLRASMFANGQPIIVNQGETAVVLEDGKPYGVLEPGLYRFERARVVGVLDVIWIKTGQRTMKWGLGNVSSLDGIQINANGVMYVRVADGVAFTSEVLQGSMRLTETDLQRFLMPRIQGVIRTVIAQTPALGLQTQRDSFTAAVRSQLHQSFTTMGVATVDFEVVDVNFPPEFKAVIAQAAMNQHAGQADIVRAQADAQIAQIRAAGDAGAQLAAGMASLQIMAALQQQGIDPLKLKALEALQTFAATPQQGGAIITGGDEKAQLFGQVAAAALAGGMVKPPAPPAKPPTPESTAQTMLMSGDGASQPGRVPSGAPTMADLQRQIDGLTARLADGSLSEAMYTKLVSGLEQRMKELGG